MGSISERGTDPTDPGAVVDTRAGHVNSKQLPRPDSLCTLIVPPI
jgi:hypothetical protein